MDTVSASHYRVFSVDPQFSPPLAYPGKLVPDGIFLDALRREGFVYGFRLNEKKDYLCYITAKFCEELPEYRKAKPAKRISEMADIRTAIAYGKSLFKGKARLPVKLGSLQEMERRWTDFREVISGMEKDYAEKRMVNLLAHTLAVVRVEQLQRRIKPSEVRKAQQAKAERLGAFGGWVITHQAIPRHEEALCTLLLKAGWHENVPDADGRFGHLRISRSLNFDHFQAVTSG